MKYGALGTCILVHVLLSTYSMGHLFYLILQVKAIQIAVKIFKIHPQTAELWNMMPEARVFFGARASEHLQYGKPFLGYKGWFSTTPPTNKYFQTRQK